MKILNYIIPAKQIVDDYGTILLPEKPVFSFSYDQLNFNSDNRIYIFTPSENVPWQDLSIEQKEEVESFIDAKRAEVGIPPVHGVDTLGKYLGYIDRSDSRIHLIVTHAPYTPDNVWRWDFDVGDWKVFYAVDINGDLVTEEQAVELISEPRPDLEYKWNFDLKKWEYDSAKIPGIKLKAVHQLMSMTGQAERSFLLKTRTPQELATLDGQRITALRNFYQTRNITELVNLYTDLQSIVQDVRNATTLEEVKGAIALMESIIAQLFET
jgi:hypothetical protein